MNFGEWIKEKRKEKKLLVKDVADKVGISVTQLISIEHGRVKNPTMHTLYKLSLALDFSMDEAYKYLRG